jgi:hypothetical protein
MTPSEQMHLARHNKHEKRFARLFYRVLQENYFEIVENFLNGQPLEQIDTTSMQLVYQTLYIDIMQSEGALTWNENVQPILGERVNQKDVFDEVASVLAPQRISEMQGFWKRLMQGFLDTYISQRVLEVTRTSVKKVSEAIQRLRNEGLTDQEAARFIQADKRARELRANTIARTEATTAMSKSQILALESSKLNWEKAWTAIRDDRTRLDHFITDPSLWIGVKENFIIGGFPMAYPGDSTQGAPIGEIINCRCMLRFRLAGERFGFRPVTRRT